MSKILLIIQREYLSRVKKRSFLLTTFLVPFLFIGMYAMVFYVAMNNEEPITTVHVIDESNRVLGSLKNTDHLIFVEAGTSSENLKKFMESGSEENTALLIVPADIEKRQIVELYDTEKKGIGTIQSIERKINEILKEQAFLEAGIDPKVLQSINPSVTVKSKQITIDGEKDSSVGAAIGISFTLSILIYISLFLYGSQVMRGIIEEKTSRIVEVIISSVKPFQLMMGKIVGIGLVGVTQFALWILLSAGLMVTATTFMSKEVSVTEVQVNNQANGSDVEDAEAPVQNSKISQIVENLKTIDYGIILGCFLVYFIGGYLLYSALFAMVGSAVDSETETQQFMFPIIMPLLFTYMLSFSVLINNPHGSVAFWLSMIPFTSPIGMLVRIPFGVPTWQLILSIVLLVLGFIVTTYLASRIYRVGILMYGKKASYKELFKWFSYRG